MKINTLLSRYRGNYKKYRSLIISLFLFFVLAVVIMTLSFNISNQLERDNQIVSTAFEQTSLLNQITSDLYIINSQYNIGEASNFTQERLRETVELIDKRVEAFYQGGELPIVSLTNFNETVSINFEPFDDPLLIEKIGFVHKQWQEYKQRILPAIALEQSTNQNKFHSRYQFYGAVLYNQGAIRGLGRLNLSIETDNFALLLQEKTNRRLDTLRMAQVVGIIITFISLLLILFFIVRKLRQSDTDLERAQDEAKGILSTIQEGLFLVDDDRIIGGEYSSELEEILGTDDIAGRDVFDLLSSMISGKDRSNLESFIKSLFNNKVIASLIMDLNPLKQLHIRIDNENGTFDEKYLSFNFYRVLKNNSITGILVSVKDITDAVLLQEQLKITEQKNEMEISTLVSLMNIEAKTTELFLENSRERLNTINNIFKSQVHNKADFAQKVSKVFSNIHSLKGEASSIGIEHIAEKAHEFETELQKLRSVDDINGMHFIPLAVMLETLISYNEGISQLMERLQNYNTPAQSNLPETANNWDNIKTLIDSLSKQYDKPVDLVLCGLYEIQISDEIKKALNTILVHFVKNCMVHGIESPQDRSRFNKPIRGRIDIRAITQPNNSLKIIIRDDGRGLDRNHILNKIAEKGIAPLEKASSWSDKKIFKHIFHDDFSTATQDMNAGRGVGLYAIHQTIKAIKGNLSMKQQTNKYCMFAITLPAN